MRSARLGWAVAGEDESVNELERRGRRCLSGEAAVFVLTCTVANQAALLTLAREPCRWPRRPRTSSSTRPPGSRLAGLVPVAVQGDAGGSIPTRSTPRWRNRTLAAREHAMRAGGICHGRRAHRGAARRRGTEARRSAHLDGARPRTPPSYARHSRRSRRRPTPSWLLEQGLPAPSARRSAGDEGTIEAARLHVRRLGGGISCTSSSRRRGGLVALDLVDRLVDDHRRARELKARLLGLDAPETNAVMIDLDADALPELEALLGVLAFAPDGRRVRLVTTGLTTPAWSAEAVASLAVITRARSSRQPCGAAGSSAGERRRRPRSGSRSSRRRRTRAPSRRRT